MRTEQANVGRTVTGTSVAVAPFEGASAQIERDQLAGLGLGRRVVHGWVIRSNPVTIKSHWKVR